MTMSDEDLFDDIETSEDDGIEPQVHELEPAPPAALSPEEIWGERALQVVAFVAGLTPPVAKVLTVVSFARRKGWEGKTLTGVLEYCEQKKLLTYFKSIHGAAWKIPLTRVFDEVPVDDAAPTSKHTKEMTMSKDWISTAEAAELLGMTDAGVRKAGKKGAIESRQEGDGAKAPFFFKRSSVIAYRDRASATDLLEQKKPRKKKPKAPKAAAAPAPAPVVHLPPPTALELADDLRTLLRCIDRGWVKRDDLVEKLRELVGA